MRYPADPPRVEEIVAVMRQAGDGVSGDRIRGLIVVLWRAGLRIQETLDLYERDLDHRRGSLLVRAGKNGRRREVGMDDWGWEHLTRGSRGGSSCRPGRCSASSTARLVGGGGPSPAYVHSCGGLRCRPGCGDGSLRISSAMPTPLRWRAKGSR
jgi:hypothetical protein